MGDFTNQINTFVNPEDAKLPLWSLTAEAGLIEKSDRYERDFLVKKKDQFKRIETNTLVYNPMNITIGSIDIYTGLYPIAVSGYYVSIVYDKNIDTDFLKEVLLLPSSLKMYKNYATGSLIERQRVQYPTFSKLQLLLPNLDEQKAIGQFFKSLNLDITLHQRKLEHLNLKKKALLQKLFPKNGERYPELRFPGFTDAWEQRKLSSLTEYIGTGKSRFVINEFGEYAILGSTNVIGYDDAYDYDGNFILTARVGANAGQLYRYSGKVKITDNTVFIMSDSSQFIYYTLTHFDLRRLSFGTGQPLVKSSELQKLELCVPVSKSEQEKIGEIFNKIDNIITLHQRKLEHLQLQKKALLQQMFV